jgi:hypothetical protein
MSTVRQVGITVIALAFSSAIAHAATQGATQPGATQGATQPGNAGANGGISPMFEALDQNKDKAIDMKEAGRSAQVKAEFPNVDSNRDGKLDQSEWTKYESKRVAPK